MLFLIQGPELLSSVMFIFLSYIKDLNDYGLLTKTVKLDVGGKWLICLEACSSMSGDLKKYLGFWKQRLPRAFYQSSTKWCIYVRVSKTPKNRGLIFTESEVRALYASWILWDPFYLCCIRSWLIQVSMIELLRLRYQINSKVMSVEWYNNSYNSRKFALNCSFH